MMNRRLLLLLFICSLVISCKNSTEEPGIEEKNEVTLVSEITNSEKLKKSLADSVNLKKKLYHFDQVFQFYSSKAFQPVWNKRELREELFKNIKNIEEDGLFFEDYHGPDIEEGLTSLSSNSDNTNTELEILLTDSFLRLTSDLGTGKLDPTKIYEIWGTPLNKINSEHLLQNAIENSNINEAIEAARPKNPYYSGLKKSLKEFRKNDQQKDSVIKISTGKLIKPGESDFRLPNIAKRFRELNYKLNFKEDDSVYNSELQETVEKFQKERGLEVDGIIGNSTIENLNLTERDRYHQILVNMERWRWYPRDLGSHYILINIANYRLFVVKEGDTISTHKTMVGTEARKTPVFSDEIAHVVYNPTWTIPPTIKKNDVIPGARKDPNYLSSKHLKIYDSNGKIVDPGSVDWSSSTAKNYTYRQGAGPSNPLGLVKIIYPNKYMIYLHDTPSKSLFEKNSRAQSSGCVRVQNALELAKYLLNDQKKYDEDKIQKIIDSGKTTEIPVTKKVKVHHFYWTAYREKNDLKFIEDIYKLDQELWQKLKV